MIKEVYHYNNELEKKMVITFLSNLNRDKINNGTANIENDKKNNLIIYNEITR